MIRVIAVAFVLAFGLALGACGGDDKNDAADDAGATAAATSPTSEATASPESGGLSGGSGGETLGFFASAECRNVTLTMAQAMSFAVPGAPATGEDPFGQLAASLDAARDAAPDDIKADMGTLASTFAEIARAIEEAGGWNPALGQIPPAEVIEALERFGAPEFTTAADNVTAWFEDNCEQ